MKLAPITADDLELTEVDGGLAILTNNSTSSWKDLKPSEIGEFLHADYIIYGRVKEFRKVRLVFSSPAVRRSAM